MTLLETQVENKWFIYFATIKCPTDILCNTDVLQRETNKKVHALCVGVCL